MVLTTIYIQFSDDGRHIRKWDRKPFEGAALFHRDDDGIVEIQRLSLSHPASKQGLGESKGD